MAWSAAVLAEEPYQYSTITFNRGMNVASGVFIEDEPIDVVNALFDNSGFMYPRAAFARFNTTAIASGSSPGITGLFRYIRRPEPPYYSAGSNLMVASGLYVWQDSSIVDSAKGFKRDPISTTRGTVAVTNLSKVVLGTNTRFLENTIPREVFFDNAAVGGTDGVIDSAFVFRYGARAAVFGDMAITNDSLLTQTNNDSTGSGLTNHRLFPAFDPGISTGNTVTSPWKFFVELRNRLYFGDSTKPVWSWDGTVAKNNYLCDSGRTYANATTLLQNGNKAWFPNQWRGFWVRFSNRIGHNHGGGGSTDVTRSPWAPIIGNNDTSLTLRFDPVYGDNAADYYIAALPIERTSKEQGVSAASANFIKLTSSAYNFADATYAICTYPLSVLITVGPGKGELHMVDEAIKDSLWFHTDPFKVAPTSASRFVLIENLPIMPKTITVHQDRLWYAQDGINKNRVYYSEPLDPPNVGPFNYIDVFPRDGDQITNIGSYQDQLLVYKTSSINRIVGDNPSNFVALPLVDNLGTPGINSRTSFAGDEYFYDQKNGIYALKEFNPTLLSAPIKPILDSISSSGSKNVSLTIYRNTLWISFSTGTIDESFGGNFANDHLMSLNLRIPDSWSRHSSGATASPGILYSWPIAGDSNRLSFGDQKAGTVFYYNDSAHTQEGAIVRMSYKTGWMALSTPEARKRLREMQFAVSSDTISGALDRDTVLLYNDFATTPFDTLLVNREGRFDNYIRRPLGPGGNGRFFQMEMRVAPRAAFRLYYARNKWRDIGF